MTPSSTPSSPGRTHVVLIPGFAGFDMLGQLEYYSGVTPHFNAWRKAHRAHSMVLHYFDNFPTAAVTTRAARLRGYLSKRIARGEISGRDQIVLVGHSTAGLDIRALVDDLKTCPDDTVVDGGAPVKASDVLKRIRRVVFLSVPQWGTLIADWVHTHWIGRKLVVADLQLAVQGTELPFVDRAEYGLASAAGRVFNAGLFDALGDTLREADDDVGPHTPLRLAAAHEAASELSLYLRHMASDFHAIDDLTSKRPRHRRGEPVSPAHWSQDERDEERRFWEDEHKIDVRSYVTLGKRPFRFDRHVAPELDLAVPCTWPEFDKEPTRSANTDVVYRTCYRACAGGRFARSAPDGPLTWRLAKAYEGPVEPWDNDGIVNTVSMAWPYGENVVVYADHMDIVGHFEGPCWMDGDGAPKAPPKNGDSAPPESRRYDLLGSDCGFNQRAFGRVWTEIFDFCAG